MLRHPAARLKPLAAFFVSACGRQFYAISAGMSVSNRPQLPAQNIIFETEKAISQALEPANKLAFLRFY